MWTEELPSGRWRGGFRVAGRKTARTFDYEYEAAAWATTAEAAALAAATSATLTTPATPAAPAIAPGVLAEQSATTAGPTPTIAAHGLDWLARRRGQLEPGTYAGYGTHVRAIIATGMGQHRIGDVRRSDVQRWVTAMVDAGTGRPTINARLKVLRMLFVDAMEERLTPVNPAAGVDYLATDSGPDRVLDRAEEKALLAVCPAELVAPVLLGVDAGLRWQEVYALKVSAVAGTNLGVWAAVVRSTGTLKGYTKDGRGRNVPVGTDRLADALAVAVKAARARGGRDALLFPSQSGGVMDYNNHRTRLWRPTMAAAAIDGAPGFHGLRHTYGSRLAAAGVPRSEIADLMGHADELTTKRYIHTGDDGRRLALVRDALAAA